MSGTGIGSLSIYKQELGRGLLPALLWLKSGDQGADWQEAEINIKGNSQYKVITVSRHVKKASARSLCKKRTKTLCRDYLH